MPALLRASRTPESRYLLILRRGLRHKGQLFMENGTELDFNAMIESSALASSELSVDEQRLEHGSRSHGTAHGSLHAPRCGQDQEQFSTQGILMTSTFSCFKS